MSGEAEIRTLLQKRLQAFSEKDAEAAVSYYSEDVVNFDLAPPLVYRGHEATGPAELQTWFGTWDGPINLEFDQLEVRRAGDLAFAHGLLRMTGLRTDGSKTDVWTRVTIGLERRSAGWLIVHEHQSFPTRMDGSGLSASDLKP